MQTLSLGIYLVAMLMTLIIYIYAIRKICKSENISISEAFGFSKGDRESRPRTKSSRVNSFSVKEQIKQLETKLWNTDDGDERKRLLDEIRELESQND